MILFYRRRVAQLLNTATRPTLAFSTATFETLFRQLPTTTLRLRARRSLTDARQKYPLTRLCFVLNDAQNVAFTLNVSEANIRLNTKLRDNPDGANYSKQQHVHSPSPGFLICTTARCQSQGESQLPPPLDLPFHDECPKRQLNRCHTRLANGE